MGFDIKEWKEKVAEGFVGWKERMSRLGVKLAYDAHAAQPDLQARRTFPNRSWWRDSWGSVKTRRSIPCVLSNI